MSSVPIGMFPTGSGNALSKNVAEMMVSYLYFIQYRVSGLFIFKKSFEMEFTIKQPLVVSRYMQ